MGALRESFQLVDFLALEIVGVTTPCQHQWASAYFRRYTTTIFGVSVAIHLAVEARIMLDDLPPELLDDILTYCTHASLKALRQCNSLLAHQTTPLIYSHLDLAFFLSSLSRLGDVARAPALAKHVRTITFHPDILPVESRATWEQLIDFRPPSSEWVVRSSGKDMSTLKGRSTAYTKYDTLPRHNLSREDLDTGWRNFETTMLGQRQWCEGVEGLVLKEALAGLPNLQSAIVQLAKPFKGGRINDIPYWKGVAKLILVGPDAWAYPMREESESDDVPWAYSGCLAGLPVLSFLEAVGYRATFSGLKPLESLELDIPTTHSFRQVMGKSYFNRGPDLTNHEMRYNLIIEAFKPLKHLVLSCPHAADDYGPGSERGAQAEEVKELLRTASQVQTLELEYGDAEKKDYDDWREHFGLTPLFSGTTVIWPFLHSLSLTASIPSAPFVNFLKLHGPTLKRLEMRDNVSDDWRAVLKAVPKVCQLEYVYLECLWQWDAGGGGGEEGVDEDEDDEGMYICHFDEGTDVDDPLNEEVKAFLLRGEGILEI